MSGCHPDLPAGRETFSTNNPASLSNHTIIFYRTEFVKTYLLNFSTAFFQAVANADRFFFLDHSPVMINDPAR